MAVLDTTIYDDQQNEIHPNITSDNITDIHAPIATTDDIMPKDHTLDMNAGKIESNDNFNRYTDTGLFNIGNVINIQNAPYVDMSYSFLIVLKTSSGVTQIAFKGNSFWIRVYSGDPASWGKWASYNHQEQEALQAQVSFLAQQMGGN